MSKPAEFVIAAKNAARDIGWIVASRAEAHRAGTALEIPEALGLPERALCIAIREVLLAAPSLATGTRAPAAAALSALARALDLCQRPPTAPAAKALPTPEEIVRTAYDPPDTATPYWNKD